MPKLKYDSDWSENNEVEIDEALHLTKEQAEKLFEKKGTIVINAEQAAAWEALELSDDTETDKPGADDRTQGESEEEDTVTTEIAAQRDKDSVAIGEKITKESTELLRKGCIYKEFTKIVPLLYLQHLRTDLGDETMAGLPVPNSRRVAGKTIVGSGDTKRELGSNEPWDKYTYQDRSEKSGKMVNKKGSNIEAIFHSSPWGKELIVDVEAVSNALASKKDNGPACPAQYKGFSTAKLARRKSLHTSRQRYGIAQTKKAINLDKQCRSFDSLSQVKYEFVTEKDDKGNEVYVNQNDPVSIFKVTTKKNNKGGIDRNSEWHSDVSIDAFLKFDVALAVKVAGGADKVTLDHILDTVKRDTAEADAAAKAKDWSKHEITKVEEVENVINSLSSYFRSYDGSIQDKRMERLFDATAKSKEFMLSVGDLADSLDDWWTKNVKAYRQLATERRAAYLLEQERKNKQDVAA